jgi:hypothetical protein
MESGELQRLLESLKSISSTFSDAADLEVLFGQVKSIVSTSTDPEGLETTCGLCLKGEFSLFASVRAAKDRGQLGESANIIFTFPHCACLTLANEVRNLLQDAIPPCFHAPDVFAFGGSPSARVRAKMYQLASQLASICIELVASDGQNQEEGDQESIFQDGNASFISLIPTVFRSSWDGFKQEMAGGTGGTAGEALEILLLIVKDVPRLGCIPELRVFDKLPVPGATLVSGLMTAYSYDPLSKGCCVVCFLFLCMCAATRDNICVQLLGIIYVCSY